MKIKKILSVLLAGSVLFVSACATSDPTKPPSDTSTPMITVNNESVSYDNFRKYFKLNKKIYEVQYGTDIWNESMGAQSFLDNFKESVLENVELNELLKQKAKAENISLKQEDIDSEYTKFKQSLDNMEGMSDYLTQNNIDEGFLKQFIETFLYGKTFLDQKRTELTVTDEEAQKYYDENKDSFSTEQVKASHILISTMDESGNPVAEAQLKEAEDKAKEVAEKAKAGQDFAALAKEYSTDPGSKDAGGELGFFSKGQMVAEFEAAAFAAEPGTITDPVKTRYGYHVIKVEDKKTDTKTFDMIKGDIKNNLVDEKLSALIETIKGEAKIESKKELLKSL